MLVCLVSITHKTFFNEKTHLEKTIHSSLGMLANLERAASEAGTLGRTSPEKLALLELVA